MSVCVGGGLVCLFCRVGYGRVGEKEFCSVLFCSVLFRPVLTLLGIAGNMIAREKFAFA